MRSSLNKPIRLTEVTRQQIRDHLLRLSVTDRYLRFCSALSDYAINTYVDNIDLSPTATEVVFAIYGSADKIVALLHAVPDNNGGVEFALSVDEDRRKEGLGDAIFERGLLHCESLGYKRIYMQCLSSNAAIKSMAHKRGMKITTDYGESIAILPDVNDHNALAAWLAGVQSDAIGLFDLRCKYAQQQWDEYVDAIAAMVKVSK